MTRMIHIAVLQAPLPGPVDHNHAVIEALVRKAAERGADVILPPELFAGPYFCKTQRMELFATAAPADEHPSVVLMQKLSQETGTAIPVSFFERDGPHYYNSVVMFEAGEFLGLYRKSHIPDGPGYQEKFYFRPGRTGFKVWKTAKGIIGVGICWDQWYPEAARAMALMGAEVLLYPTAIGSEPQDVSLDTRGPWRRAMQGHAASNAMPVAAANRIGIEDGQHFYGNSFIAQAGGELLAEFGDAETGVLDAIFDLDDLAARRAEWGFFRDRRADLYSILTE
jgi:N-carbamoylputrescine amidase